MELLIFLGLLTLGLLFGIFSDDDAAEPEPPEETDRNVVEGTSGNDDLAGGPEADLIFGNRGADTLYGRAGDDWLFGGAGGDVLVGDSGDDIIAGGSGDDLAYGGQGDDLILGGEGDDTLYGLGGDDSLVGVSGSNLLYGGDGNDLLNGLDVPDDWALIEPGSEAEDAFIAALRADFAPDLTEAQALRAIVQLNSSAALPSGGTGDTLIGGRGDDTLVGDSGDVMTGGAGNDLFVINALRDDQAYTSESFEPVRITDFQPGTTTEAGDLLEIVYRGDPEAARPEIALRQVGTSVHVDLGTTTVAVLENRVAANMTTAAIRLVDVAGLPDVTPAQELQEV